jgi:hypothetical protein
MLPVPDEPEPVEPEPEMPLEPLTPVDPLPVAPTPELTPVPVPVVDLRCLVEPDAPLKSLPVPAPVPLLYDEPPEPDALPKPDVPVCACAHVPMLSNNAESKMTFLFFMSILLYQCLSAEFDDDLFLHGATRTQVGHGRDVASENSSRRNCCDEGIRVMKADALARSEGG